MSTPHRLNNILAVTYISVALYGCGSPPTNPPPKCANPGDCFYFQPVRDNSCLLPNDPSTAERFKVKLQVNYWQLPNKELNIGLIKRKSELNDSLVSEERVPAKPYLRRSSTDLGCAHTVENGKLYKLSYSYYCAAFSGSPCITSSGTEKVAANFPATCPFSIDEASIRNAIKKTTKLINDDSKYPFESSVITSYFSSQPGLCERDLVTLDGSGSNVIWNVSNQTCTLSTKETVQGETATLLITVPTIVKAERNINTTDTTLSFFETYAPAIRSDDNETVSKLISGTISGLRLKKDSSQVFIKRDDGSTTCISVIH